MGKRIIAPRSFVPLMALLTLVSLSSPVSAQDHTWTTTSEFDGGTFSESDGNRETNSNTCNPGITAGQIELGSLKGDSFCITDSDADTFKWNPVGSPYNVCTTIERVIAAGEYYQNLSGTSCLRGIATATTFNGSWDIRVKVLRIENATSAQHELDAFTVGNAWCAAGAYGFMVYMTSAALLTDKCLAGVPSNVGNAAGVTTNPIWLRLALSGTTITSYSSADGLTWDTRHSATDAGFAGSFYAMLSQYTGGSTTRARFDDFHVASGTIDPGGFRSSGNWLSPIYPVPGTATTRRVDSVRVSHSGLNATYAIDRVEMIRNGFVEETFETDVTAGSQTDYELTQLIEGGTDFRVRVYLKGDGAGTPVIAEVSVFLHTIIEPSAESSILLWVLVFAMVFLTAIGFIFEDYGWFAFIFAGITGMVLGVEAGNVTGSTLAFGLVEAIGIFLIIMGAYDALR